MDSRSSSRETRGVVFLCVCMKSNMSLCVCVCVCVCQQSAVVLSGLIWDDFVSNSDVELSSHSVEAARVLCISVCVSVCVCVCVNVCVCECVFPLIDVSVPRLL